MAALIPRPNYPPYSASGAVDAGREEVDEILLRLERRVHREYVQAAREMKEKADAYFDYFQSEDAKLGQWVKEGKITADEYKRWRISHLATSNHLYEMADVLAKDMTNTNQIAASMINGYLPDVFAVGHNYGLYQCEITGGMRTSFTLYDRDTVIRLIRDEPDLLPIEAKVNVPKDLLWNRQQLASIMTQGILQGETLDQIAKRIATAMPSMNEKTAIRHARTAFTSAENGGRYESYRRMKKAGVDLTVEWCATLDGRTRHTHRLADGERRDVDEPFDVDGYNIMYAGDPQAPQKLIWNCRCTMLAWVKDFEPSSKLKEQTRPDNMSYAEWKVAKQAEYEQQQERARQRAQINPDNPSYGYANRNPFKQYASAVDMGTLHEAQNGAGYYQEQQISPRNDLTLRNDDGIMQENGYHYNDDGIIIVTDDWTSIGKTTIPRTFTPFAVIQTKRIFKDGAEQVDRTLYDENGLMSVQIHSGAHNRPDLHPYGKHGEHHHYYVWKEGTDHPERITGELTDLERKEHGDIL